MGIDIPKGLIEIARNQTIIGSMLKELQNISNIKNKAMTTNSRFFQMYAKWLKQEKLDRQTKLLNNGAKSPEERLGAIGDIIFALDKLKWWGKNNLLILPSDTLYQFRLRDFINFSLGRQGLVIVISKLDKKIIANRLGCISFRGDRVIGFEEKPALPKSNWAIVPFYFYPKALLPRIREYAQEAKFDKKKLDAPSTIIYWLMKKNIPVYVFKTEKLTIDVGKPVDVDSAQANNHCFLRQEES